MNQPPPTIVAGGTPAPAIPPPRRSFHGHRGKMPPRCQNRTHQDARSRILIETPRPWPPPSGDEWPQLATYPQSPFSGPEALLRRSVPVPGILAAHRPGAIMDKSGHHFVARSLSRDGQNQTMN
jgi:hypothetical protein